MPFTDVMIDIETLSTDPNAAVIQIGAVAFNLQTGEIGKRPFKIHVFPSPESTVSYDTVCWWMQQSDEARKSVFETSACAVEYEAVFQLETWLQLEVGDTKETNFWAMPPTFDLTILENMMARAGCAPLWKYNRTRCLRTLAEVAGAKKEDRVVPTIAHDAAADALAQAQSAIKYYRMLKGEI